MRKSTIDKRYVIQLHHAGFNSTKIALMVKSKPGTIRSFLSRLRNNKTTED